MIFLIKFLDNTTLSVSSISLKNNKSATNQIEMIKDKKTEGYYIPERQCRSLDGLLGRNSTLLWMSDNDFDYFMKNVKHSLNFRIRKHSVVLPSHIADKIRKDNNPIRQILNHEGIYEESDLMKLQHRRNNEEQ